MWSELSALCQTQNLEKNFFSLGHNIQPKEVHNFVLRSLTLCMWDPGLYGI